MCYEPEKDEIERVLLEMTKDNQANTLETFVNKKHILIYILN